MKKEDWNWVALLCMANLFAGIVKTIIYEATGTELPFIGYFVLYGIFYGIVSVIFRNSEAFNHTKYIVPMIIYFVIDLIAAILSVLITDIFNIEASYNLLLYIIVAVLGVLICRISHFFYE